MDEGEIKGIASLGVPRKRRDFFADEMVWSGDSVTIYHLATKERGYGKRMMKTLAQNLVTKNWSLTWICTEESRGFYEALGFQSINPDSQLFRAEAGDLKQFLAEVKAITVSNEELAKLEPKSGVFTVRPQASKQSDIAKQIAERVDREDVTADMIQEQIIDAWNQATMGTPNADLLQKTAAKTFGHQYPDQLEDLEINWDMLYPIGEIYNITHEYLEERGFSEEETIPVYHPYIPSGAAPKKWKEGQEVRIKLNPLTSWSFDINEAAKVASYLSSPSTPGFVLKTFIPVRSIVSMPNTGFGLEGTKEVVLAGGEYEAIVEQKMG
jgi:hypothetical protein